MDRPLFLNISKHNMNKFLYAFNKNIKDDILLNINDIFYFLDVLASLIYLQHNDTVTNSIIIAPNTADNISTIFIDDDFCENAGFNRNNTESINSLEFFQKYSDAVFYLKT